MLQRYKKSPPSKFWTNFFTKKSYCVISITQNVCSVRRKALCESIF